MTLTPDQQLDDIINQLHGMTNERLKEIVRTVDKITEKRQENRKKELWGNVVAAIAKYEREIEPISFWNRHRFIDCTINEIEKSEPGAIIIS